MQDRRCACLGGTPAKRLDEQRWRAAQTGPAQQATSAAVGRRDAQIEDREPIEVARPLADDGGGHGIGTHAFSARDQLVPPR